MAKAWQSDDGNKLLTYNALDTVATARVDREVTSEEDWNSPRVQRLLQVHEKLSIIGSKMHMRGFPVHKENRAKLIKQLKMLGTRRHNELVAHVGPRRSPAFRGTDNDMRALLYQRHAKDGIRCFNVPEPELWDGVMWTNPEEPVTLAVSKPALLRIFINPATPQEVRECLSLFWRAKAPGKALSTWVGEFNSKGEPSEIQQRLCDDGRIRAEWNSAGTETMRWAGELMTLPEEKNDDTLGGKLPNIRSMYCASPGMELFHWDWSQQELRVWAAVYRSSALFEALETGDVYSYDARKWFPKQLQKEFGAEWETINLKKAWKNGRRQVKVIHLGCQYMAGAPTVWTQGLIQDQTLKFHTVKHLHQNGFHVTYADGVNAIKVEHDSVLQTGYSEGRILQGRRYYPAPPPITETANYPVQRTAGEMGALTMIAIDEIFTKEKMPAYILTNEHDAGTIEHEKRDSIRREVADVVKSCAQGPWDINGYKLFMPVGYHSGHTWAEACAD